MRCRLLLLTGVLGLASSFSVACVARGSLPDADAVRLRLGFVGPNLPGVGVPAVVDLLSSSSLLFRDATSPEHSPALIERIDTSPDGRRYTLHLRPHLQLHDGGSLTAAALQPVLADLKDRGSAFPHRHIARVSVVSSDTLDVELTRPSPLFLESLVDVTLPEGQGGAGAFVPVRGEETVALRSFDHFFLGRPSVESMQVDVFPTWRAAWGAMLRGEVDGLWEAPTEAISFIEAASDFRIYGTVRRYAYTLGFNVRSPRLRRAEVRRAFAQAIDRERFIRVALRGHGQATATQLHRSHWAMSAAVTPLPFDRARAQAVLSVAPGTDHHRPSTAAGTLDVECLVPADDRFERVAQELRRQLSAVGVELRLVPLPMGDFLARLRDGRFETFIIEAAGQSPLFLERFWASYAMPYFNSGYRSADAALLALRDAQTVDDLRTAVARVQTVLRDDPPAVFLAYPTVARVLHQRFVVPPIPEEASLISQRVLPFLKLKPPSEKGAS